jgi:hypothetical protein
MPFIPGQSGNPKGRKPVGTTIAEKIRKRAGIGGDRILSVVFGVLHSSESSDADKLKAAAMLMERGYGRIVPLEGADSGQPTRVIYEYPAGA